MPPRDDATRLRHMLDHAAEALAMAEGRTRTDLDADRQFSLAIVRLMEIVGEAAARVSAPTRAAHPGIAWPQIIAFRNRLIHGYDEVDFDILWRILCDDLPPLIDRLRGVTDA